MNNQPVFDVFLAHNSKDKDIITVIAESLQTRNLNPWLDKDQILGGDLILDRIQSAISQSKCAAFFIGQHGLGPWHKSEMKSLIQQSITDSFKVIPILLPGVSADILKTEDFLFLRQRSYLELRSLEDYEEFLTQLLKSIQGRPSQSNEIQNLSLPRNEVEEAKQEIEALNLKKFDLEKKLERVNNKIAELELSLMDEVSQEIRILIGRLLKAEKLAKSHVSKILKQQRFESLKRELEQKNNLDRLCLEIKTYVERLRVSFQRGNHSVLRNPRLAPTLNDSNIYQSPSFEIYTCILRSIKDDISDDLDPITIQKIEDHVEFLLKRLLTRF
jgi:TIR domain